VTEDAIRRHCTEIDRCNQRGGRMLSIVDLIEAGTMSVALAAYCLAAIRQGASFLVGAVPGGAGKTTVMGALLNFVPDDVELRPADGLAAIETAARSPEPRCCHICHEIGRGPYYAYLWGDELRAFFDLPGAGHMIATNLHADTYEQARDQICGDNGVSDAALRRMNLMLFLSVGGSFGARRRIAAVWESDGTAAHRQVFSADRPDATIAATPLVAADAFAAARSVIDRITSDGARTIEDVRAAMLQST
jgi:hypothetical protein